MGNFAVACSRDGGSTDDWLDFYQFPQIKFLTLHPAEDALWLIRSTFQRLHRTVAAKVFCVTSGCSGRDQWRLG
jgi:hypothetical protein